MEKKESQELLERGFSLAKLTAVIKAVQSLNDPGLHLHEAGERLTPERVEELAEELSNAHHLLCTGTRIMAFGTVLGDEETD